LADLGAQLKDWISGTRAGENPSPVLTKAEWKAKLAEHNQFFRQTGSIVTMERDEFVNLMGTPDRTATHDGHVYWYYKCADGMIQIVGTESAFDRGGVAGRVDDY
jgi:hypothetical protein